MCVHTHKKTRTHTMRKQMTNAETAAYGEPHASAAYSCTYISTFQGGDAFLVDFPRFYQVGNVGVQRLHSLFPVERLVLGSSLHGSAAGMCGCRARCSHRIRRRLVCGNHEGDRNAMMIAENLVEAGREAVSHRLSNVSRSCTEWQPRISARAAASRHLPCSLASVPLPAHRCARATLTLWLVRGVTTSVSSWYCTRNLPNIWWRSAFPGAGHTTQHHMAPVRGGPHMQTAGPMTTCRRMAVHGNLATGRE
eukprot:GHVU01034945.1.p1 GENE.GHVU01034945.1~~GHVU01034945.1.p1  ORF type:complete len:251 (+),score=13.38 GHVU01034945.1:935-1687(+)